MDILKAATDWAKAEVFSSQFFIFFGVLFLLGSIGFWQLGKTDVARAYIIPMLVAGILVLTVGIGIFVANKSRVTSFAEAHSSNPIAFVQSEITRTEQSVTEYRNIVFKAIPIIIIIAAMMILFLDKPIWRAISTTTIAMMIVIVLLDNNANARLEAYHDQLEIAANDLNIK